MQPRFYIVRAPEKISPYLDCIRNQADLHRNELGFLPRSAYAEQLQSRRLLLLTADEGGTRRYAGHLLFGGTYPSMRIFQLVVAPEYRGQGCGTRLIRALASQAEHRGYLNISAHVADDLVEANRFYELNGFAEVKRRAGGKSRGRNLVVRSRELESPSLLSLMSAKVPPIGIAHGLGGPSTSPPLYAIDLNVYFDVFKKNRGRKQQAQQLISAALRLEIRIAVTSEVASELKRSSADGQNDPALQFAKNLPQLPSASPQKLAEISTEVEKLLFAHRDNTKPLSKQNQSDVAQLAQASAAGATGYITSDGKILSSRDGLFRVLGLDVVGLNDYVGLLNPLGRNNNFHLAVEQGLEIDTSADLSQFWDALQEHNLPSDLLAKHPEFQGANVQTCLVRGQGACIGASILGTKHVGSAYRCYIWVDPHHPLAPTVADRLFSDISKTVSKYGIGVIETDEKLLEPITNRIAVAHGFRRSHGANAILRKIAVGRVITEETWETFTDEIAGAIEIDIRRLDSGGARLKVSTRGATELECEAQDLETLLSPFILALPGRPSVLVPIQKQYATDLLGMGPQLSFLSGPEASFLRARTYFNSPRAARLMIPGGIVVFYESIRSGGAGAAIAIARIVDVTLVPKASVPETLSHTGVVKDLKTLTAGDRVVATTFDNAICLDHPVPLKKLQQIGCVGGSNLQTATALQTGQLAAIISAAQQA